MLVPVDLQRQGFYEVWVHYIEGCHRAIQVVQALMRLCFPMKYLAKTQMILEASLLSTALVKRPTTMRTLTLKATAISFLPLFLSVFLYSLAILF